MFSKTSIQSFVYNLIDVFMFPDDVVKEIYKKMKFKNVFCFKISQIQIVLPYFFLFLYVNFRVVLMKKLSEA